MIAFRFFCTGVAGAALTLANGFAATATNHAADPPAPATSYVYDGVVYDRYFFELSRTRPSLPEARARVTRRTPQAQGAPYRIADLGAETGLLGGVALAVDDAGDIAYVYRQDPHYVYGDPEVVHDDGTYTSLQEPAVDQYGDGGAIPYALDDAGDAVGVAVTQYFSSSFYHFHADWTPTRTYLAPAFKGSFAYAVNAANVSVGQALFGNVPAAAVFTISPQGGERHPVMLLPPKGTSWVGTATGINDAGTIVGYAKDRAVVFHQHGYAQVLPVGGPGMSTSAQAINRHGDIVGSAGSEAFLYRDNRTTYLPRPAGETAGNAFAVAIDASDVIVGNIVDPVTRASTAFLYVGGQSYDLNSLLPADSGWQITSATGINDAGEIVGSATNANGSTAVSLKPQAPASRARASAFVR